VTPEGRAPRLLAIDDEEGLLAILRDVGASVGYDVETTTDAAAFLQRARERPPALILMDLQMPDVDGVELLRRLAAEGVTVPIVLMSGVDDKLLRAVADLGRELGLNLHENLTKPIRRQVLAELLAANAVPSRVHAVDELRIAIETNALVLHYQPIVRLPRRELVAVEALVRWNHPERGLVGPNEFVPLAEANGLIDALTGFVVREAIVQAARWSDAGNPLAVSINLSALNLVDTGFPDRVEALCLEHGVPPERTWFELTETATNRDPTRLKAILSRLRLKRFRLAIDDFGIGYSSLMQLRSLPFNELKIDKSFVHDLLVSEDAAIIVDAILALAGAFHMDVVAEGIETEAQLEALVQRGCTMAQGYLIARPQPATQIDRSST